MAKKVTKDSHSERRPSRGLRRLVVRRVRGDIVITSGLASLLWGFIGTFNAIHGAPTGDYRVGGFFLALGVVLTVTGYLMRLSADRGNRDLRTEERYAEIPDRISTTDNPAPFIDQNDQTTVNCRFCGTENTITDGLCQKCGVSLRK